MPTNEDDSLTSKGRAPLDDEYDANENENETIALPFSSLSSSLLFVVCLALAGFFFSVFFLGFSPSPLSKVSLFVFFSLLDNNEKKKKRGKRVFSSLQQTLSLFLCFAAALFFFLFDETKRHETDLMSAQKKNIAKKREREKPKKDKRQNVKTRKRALREEKASPFSVEKERATFYPFDFFSSRGDT